MDGVGIVNCHCNISSLLEGKGGGRRGMPMSLSVRFLLDGIP